MDPQFEQWQQSFQQSTPQVDAQKLVSQVSKMHKRETLKALIDLVAGVMVSVFCVYVIIYHIDTTIGQLFVAILAPIPLAFSIWAYRLRKSASVEYSLDIHQLLQFKRQKLIKQVQYWRVSAWVVIGLWLGLFVVASINYMFNGYEGFWSIQVIIQTGVVMLTWARYRFVKQQLPKQLAKIEMLD
ncbi:MAG: hypothetical protein ABJV04_13010 [Aliiglaciecola sp.]|uniref:hypothetical protein n=1 Tax=Aliiglaciecola sp. TaxID=1872441 RepID=UPI003298DB50